MRSRLFAPLLVLLFAGVSGVAHAQVSTPAIPLPTAPPTAAAPSCHTVDGNGQPATLFAPGDRIVIAGDGFGSGVTPVRITFVQGTRTITVGIAYTDELGTFNTETNQPKIPDTAAPGPASMHAFSASRLATCAVQVMAAANQPVTSQPKTKRSRLLALWIAALVVFGLFLLLVIVRRWRLRRLAAKVDPTVPRLEVPVVPPRHPKRDERPLPAGESPPSGGLLDVDEPRTREPIEPVVHDEPDVVGIDLLPADLPDEAASSDGEDSEEFVFREGEWRLRDDFPGGPVDVADAREVADAFHVPEISRDAERDEAILDPFEADEEEWEPPAREAPSARPPAPDKPVSDTVARLVENAKDWKR